MRSSSYPPDAASLEKGTAINSKCRIKVFTTDGVTTEGSLLLLLASVPSWLVPLASLVSLLPAPPPPPPLPPFSKSTTCSGVWFLAQHPVLRIVVSKRRADCPQQECSPRFDPASKIASLGWYTQWLYSQDGKYSLHVVPGSKKQQTTKEKRPLLSLCRTNVGQANHRHPSNMPPCQLTFHQMKHAPQFPIQGTPFHFFGISHVLYIIFHFPCGAWFMVGNHIPMEIYVGTTFFTF